MTYTLAVARHGAIMQLKLPALLACTVSAYLLAGCGQTGALYLPDEAVTTPVEIRPAPTTAPEPGQAPAEEKKTEPEAEGTPPARE